MAERTALVVERCPVDFCEHCQGQRFDRARVLRALRQVRAELRAAHCGRQVDAALQRGLNAVRGLDLPHLDVEDPSEDQVVH
jgi:hypothetical protein